MEGRAVWGRVVFAVKNFEFNNKSRAGFTLVELLVVIALISILSVATVVIIDPTKRIKSARDASRKNSIGQIVTGLSSSYAQKHSYPAALIDLVPVELQAVPVNPTGQNFGYEAMSENNNLCTTAGKDCQKVIIYDLYELPNITCPEGTRAYLAWTGSMIGLGKICSAELPTPNSLPTQD